LQGQAQERNQDIDTLIKEYHSFFIKSKSLVEEFAPDELVYKSQGLWKQLLQDNDADGLINKMTKDDLNLKQSFSDLGLKWMSDITHNFMPGLAETEDVYFRSRISTGIDWVILGEGSWLKRKEERWLFQQQFLKDSLLNQIRSKDIIVQNKRSVLQSVFDIHRIALLKKYALLLQQQAAYSDKMYEQKLMSYADKLKNNQRLNEIENTIALKMLYQDENINQDFIDKYLAIPFDFEDLPDRNFIREDNLMKKEEDLFLLQKEITENTQRASDRPSLRAKVRYNYFDTAEQQSRSFASVGASLSVPVRFEKNSPAISYQLAEYENRLFYEKLRLKEHLIRQHRDFYALKIKKEQIENELDYIQALLRNELEVYNEMNQNFSPAKYIGYAEELILKKMELLDIQQQLCEGYILFHIMSDLDENGQFRADLPTENKETANNIEK